MSHRSIKPRVLATMATAILTLVVAACSSSGSSTPSGTSSSPSSGMGTKTLVVESTPLSPLTQTFKGVVPFLISDGLRIVLLVFFPIISLYLVHTFKR